VGGGYGERGDIGRARSRSDSEKLEQDLCESKSRLEDPGSFDEGAEDPSRHSRTSPDC